MVGDDAERQKREILLEKAQGPEQYAYFDEKAATPLTLPEPGPIDGPDPRGVRYECPVDQRKYWRQRVGSAPCPDHPDARLVRA